MPGSTDTRLLSHFDHTQFGGRIEGIVRDNNNDPKADVADMIKKAIEQAEQIDAAEVVFFSEMQERSRR
jgi:hypothetical protein